MKRSEDFHLHGPPELVVEISSTTLHLDVGEKRDLLTVWS